MWPFKPAWMSENTDKAKKAVDLITDQEKLAQIVMEAPHYGVREAALAKIESQSLLAKFAKSDGGLIAEKAAARVTDNAVLKELILDPAVRYAVRGIATQAVTDQELLEEIARTGPEHSLKLGAILKLTNQPLQQELLEEIARTAPDHEIRLRAIKGLTNEHLLAELAKTVTCTGVYAAFTELVEKSFSPAGPDAEGYTGWAHIHSMRMAAVSRITDQNALADVLYGFINDRGEGWGWEVPKSAAGRLHDQDHLKKVITALTALGPDISSVDTVLCAAIEQITDKNFLAQLMTSGALSHFTLGYHAHRTAERKLQKLNQKASEESGKEQILQCASAYINENAVEDWALQFVSAYIDKNSVKGLSGLEVELVKPFFAELFSHYKQQADGKPGLTICTRCDGDLTPGEPVFLTGSGRCLCERCSLIYIIGNASDWHYYLGNIASLIGHVPSSLQKKGLALQERITQLRNGEIV